MDDLYRKIGHLLNTYEFCLFTSVLSNERISATEGKRKRCFGEKTSEKGNLIINKLPKNVKMTGRITDILSRMMKTFKG